MDTIFNGQNALTDLFLSHCPSLLGDRQDALPVVTSKADRPILPWRGEQRNEGALLELDLAHLNTPVWQCPVNVSCPTRGRIGAYIEASLLTIRLRMNASLILITVAF